MKRLLILLIYFPMLISAQDDLIRQTFIEKWQNSKDYLIKIAETMPEEHYSFQPSSRSMKFSEQLGHICQNMIWLSTTYFENKSFDRVQFKKQLPASKDELISFLKDCFDRVSVTIKDNTEDLSQKVEFFAGPKTKLQILNLLHDHVTHHRGQLIVYLNLNEVKPPAYSGW